MKRLIARRRRVRYYADRIDLLPGRRYSGIGVETTLAPSRRQPMPTPQRITRLNQTILDGREDGAR